MKFLLAVKYGLPRRQSKIYKTFQENREKLKYIFMIILGVAESFKTMNRPPYPSRPYRSLTAYFSKKYK